MSGYNGDDDFQRFDARMERDELDLFLSDPDGFDPNVVYCVDCGMKGHRDAVGNLPPLWTDQGSGLIRCVRDSERGL